MASHSPTSGGWSTTGVTATNGAPGKPRLNPPPAVHHDHRRSADPLPARAVARARRDPADASIYWLTNTGASSARFYYEDRHSETAIEPTTFPIGLAAFAYDFTPLRRFVARDHTNVVHWQEYDRGSHWSAHDAPDLLIGDLRQFFRRFR
jgi:hypothetical protein